MVRRLMNGAGREKEPGRHKPAEEQPSAASTPPAARSTQALTVYPYPEFNNFREKARNPKP